MLDRFAAFPVFASSTWEIGLPGVIDPKPQPRCPLDDARGDEMLRDALGNPPLGLSNDGKTPVFASGTVRMRRDIRGRAG